MQDLWHSFIPLFVAFDGIGLLPIFWLLTQDRNEPERRRVAAEGVITAGGVALVFLLLSRVIFELMGLSLADIMIAGGLILIVLCLRDLLISNGTSVERRPSPGFVPLGVPLLAGPAVLTTLILVRDQHGWPLTLGALALTLFLVWLILSFSSFILRWVGQTGAEGVSKVFSLVLTAYGVMLIRRGILTLLERVG
jgi:multiple antibiotic resistance protein